MPKSIVWDDQKRKWIDGKRKRGQKTKILLRKYTLLLFDLFYYFLYLKHSWWFNADFGRFLFSLMLRIFYVHSWHVLYLMKMKHKINSYQMKIGTGRNLFFFFWIAWGKFDKFPKNNVTNGRKNWFLTLSINWIVLENGKYLTCFSFDKIRTNFNPN